MEGVREGIPVALKMTELEIVAEHNSEVGHLPSEPECPLVETSRKSLV